MPSALIKIVIVNEIKIKKTPKNKQTNKQTEGLHFDTIRPKLKIHLPIKIKKILATGLLISLFCTNIHNFF